MKATRVSFPDDLRAELCTRAIDAGFFGPTALSSFFRHVILEHLCLPVPGRVCEVAPIIAQPTSIEQRRWFESYALLKHFPNVEAFALYSMGAMTKKVPLTGDEEEEYVRMMAGRDLNKKR